MQGNGPGHLRPSGQGNTGGGSNPSPEDVNSVPPPASGSGRAARRTLRGLREESRDYLDGVVDHGPQATETETKPRAYQLSAAYGVVDHGPQATETDSEPRAYRLSAAFRSEVRRTYAKPPRYRTAWEVLTRRRLLILSGRAHRGKWTSAVRLTAACSQVVKLDPSVRLGRLHQYRFDESTGYIIDTLSRASAALLDRFTLDLLGEWLAERNAVLVITLDSATRPEDEPLDGFEVLWEEPPDRRLALRRHATWLLRDDEPGRARVEQLLTDPIVAQELGKAREPRQIAEIAKVLVDGARTGLGANQALANRAATRCADVIHRFQQADLAGQALMIALSVFDGLSYSRMLEAAEQLHKMLDDRLDESFPKGSPSFSRPNLTKLQRSARLGALQAETFLVEELRAHGPQLVRAVRYKNHQMVDWILQHVWEEHDIVRRPIVAWLDELASDDDPEVRWAAGMALGILSTSDFAYLLDEVFMPWAENNAFRRSAAAVALGVPAAHSEHFHQVDSLLRLWSRSGSPPERWTAAISYGLVFGRIHPHIALDELQQLADSRNPTLRFVVPTSVIRLFLAGDTEPRLYRMVLKALVDWTSDRSLPRSAAGRAAFLGIAQPESRSRTPAPLWRAIRVDSACIVLGATLWRTVLIEPDTRGKTFQALRQAFLVADQDADLARGLRAVMAEIARTAPPTELAPLRYQLDKWADDPRESSATAHGCLQRLDEKGVPA